MLTTDPLIEMAPFTAGENELNQVKLMLASSSRGLQ
jgi:hypothetical protein